MLVFPPDVKIYLCASPTDMRKSFQTLSLVVTNHMELEPADGSMYVFWNKAKDKLKILQWHNNSFWLHYNRLAKGTYGISALTDATSLEISSREINRILSGYDLTNVTEIGSNNVVGTKMF